MSEASSPFVQQAVPIPSPTSYIQPDMNYALRVWWAYYWPCVCASLLMEFIYKNALMSGPLRLSGVRGRVPPAVSISDGLIALAVLVAEGVLTVFVMRYVLGKTFRNFRIALVTPDFASPQPLPVTFARALRVWWFFTWRVVLYTVLGTMFLIYPLGMFVGLFNPTPVVREFSAEILKFLMTAGISLYIIYSDILDEDMGDFHVALLPRVVAVEALPFS